ncbi:MAG: hypothetical protein RQ847_06775 [Wenzhouxiangellaceae bacterium]|nr:hypothetical protein [Wenzhouxiangellaceae bacterium]
MPMNELRGKLMPLHRRATAAPESCPAAERLARLAAGSVWPWQRSRLVRHLGECSDCADDYRTLLAARDGLSAALGLDAGKAPASLASGVATAAALGLVVLAAALVFEPDGHRAAPGFDTHSDADTIFASNFGLTEGDGRPDSAPGDVLFRSDFDGSRGGGS